MDDLAKQAKDLLKGWSSPFGQPSSFQGQGRKLGGTTGSDASGSGAGRPLGVPRSGAAAGRALHDTVEKQEQIQRRQQEERRQQMHAQWAGERGGPVQPPQPQHPTKAVSSGSGRSGAGGGNGGSSAGAGLHSDAGKTTGAGKTAATSGSASALSAVSAGGVGGGSSMGSGSTAASAAASCATCPVCSVFAGSEEQVAAHVDDCLARGLQHAGPGVEQQQQQQQQGGGEGWPRDAQPHVQGTGEAAAAAAVAAETDPTAAAPSSSLAASDSSWGVDLGDAVDQVHHAAALLLSASPPPATLDTLTKLLRNVLSDPSAVKFRRVRLSNPRIAESIVGQAGALALMRAVGFKEVREEAQGGGGGAEPWAVMGEVREELVLEALQVLSGGLGAREEGSGAGGGGGRFVLSASAAGAAAASSGASDSSAAAAEGVSQSPLEKLPSGKIDRQLRVFLSSSESHSSRIEVPDTFFDRSADDVRQEALTRRRAQEGSQLLMTRAMRERQAAAIKRRYKAAIVRVMFPDGIVVQGVFRPGETTAALYEFVSSALKDPHQLFELLHSIPMAGRSQTIPSLPLPGMPLPSLESQELVPASLIKFKPQCLGPPGYTGLRRELLEQVQPLTSVPFPPLDTSGGSG